MMQQETGDLKESGYGNVDFGTPTDDEEVTIPSQDRNKEVPDFPDIDIRDEQTLSNTQREDWLLPTEPLQGARPRQTGRERPPVIDNRPPMDAAGGAASRKPGRQQDIGSPVDMLVNTVSRMQKDMATLREENRLLRTLATSQVVQAPRRQVFEAIVQSNGWDNDTAALQLFSHLEGDALNVAHLVPLARRLSRSGLVDALTDHYGSLGRLADY